MTEIESARKGIINREIAEVAEDEGLTPEEIRALVASGEVVIPHNAHHQFRAIGWQTAAHQGQRQYRRVEFPSTARRGGREALHRGALRGRLGDGSFDRHRPRQDSRRAALTICLLGTVPIYQVASEHSIMELDAAYFLEVIERQARQGVDYMTLHCGVTRQFGSPNCAGISGIEGIVSPRRRAAGRVDGAHRRRRSSVRTLSTRSARSCANTT